MTTTSTTAPIINREQWQQAATTLASRHSTFVLFSSPHNKNSRWSLMGWGWRQRITVTENTLQWTQPDIDGSVQKTIENNQTLWGTLENARQGCQHYWRDKPKLAFHGGLVGLLHYEAATLCDRALERAEHPTATARVSVPMVEFIECDHWALWDHSTGKVFVSNPDPFFATMQSSNTAIDSQTLPSLPALTQPWQASLSPKAFETQVSSLLNAIQHGESYQANLSIQWKSQINGNLWPIYQALTAKNPSPFSGFWQTSSQTVVCNSPERLVAIENRWDRDSNHHTQWATTRPIAGTRGRGSTDAEDQLIGQTLQNDTKEQAEHLMLVDLLRNDLGKIARIGSVNVRELMVLERYAHVTHLVSDIEGQLLPQTTPWQVLQAVFPGGTITGCPKIRSVQWLNRCEPVPRGPYTGSMGYVDALTGSMDWNIIIRSLYATPSKPTNNDNPSWNIAFHAGAGIVADSIPAHEYRECLRKSHSIFSLWE